METDATTPDGLSRTPTPMRGPFRPRVLVGYRPMPADAKCPYCGECHGSIETTEDPGVYTYRCWCGAKCKLDATVEELVAMGVPADRLP